MRKLTKVQVDPWVTLLLVLACFLLFKNLGNIYFWEDEAETALLARSILHFGYPKGFDGINLLRPILGIDSNYWVYHPWFSFYVTAFFFWLFGESNFVGRLPFVLFGLGSLILTYSLARRLYPQRGIARVTLLLLVFCIPFYLHMRQCRYYAPTLFFSLGAMIAFLKFLDKERFSSLLLILSTLLLYFTNNGIWIPLILTQFIYLLLFSRGNRETLRRFGWVLLWNSLLAIPWYAVSHSLVLGGHPTFEHSRKNLEFYIRVINKYIMPLAFWIIFLGLITSYERLRSRRGQVLTPYSALAGIGKSLKSRSSILLVLWVVITLVFLVFVEQRHFRYLTSLLPAFLILEAIPLWHLIQSRLKILGIFVLMALLLTNSLNSPHRISSPFLNYLDEINHDYNGPNEGIILYLKKHAKAGDIVKLKYEDYPLMFYTRLKVDNRWYMEEETYPEWIIPRRPWAEDGFWNSSYYTDIQKRYERVKIDYPDIQWENREDPGYHNFRTVKEAPEVIIYRRKDTT